MCTPVFTNWLSNTGAFTTYPAHVIAICRMQDATEFLNRDKEITESQVATNL